MKEIKSFREYILEKSLLGEADGSEKPSADEKEKEGSDEKPKQQPETPKKDKLGVTEVISSFSLNRTMVKNDIVGDLRLKYDILRNTFRDLERILIADELKSVDASSANQDALINVTGGNTLSQIRKEFETKILSKVKAGKTNSELTRIIKKIQKGEDLTPDEKDVYEKHAGLVNQDSLDESVRIDNLKQRLTDLWHSKSSLGRTSNEVASGLASHKKTSLTKFSARNILDKEKSIYNVDYNFLQDMYNEYLKNAQTIIRKERYRGLSYLTAANSKLDKFENTKIYIKGTDEAYAAGIKRDLNGAWSVLTSIGDKLKVLMLNYQKALERVEEELDVKGAENISALSGTNAKKAKINYNSKLQQQADDEAEQKAFNARAKALADKEKAEEEAEREREKKDNENYNYIKASAKKYLDKIMQDEKNYEYGALNDLADEISESTKILDKNASDEEIEEQKNKLLGQYLGLYVFAKRRKKLSGFVDNPHGLQRKANDLFDNAFKLAKWLFRGKRNSDIVKAIKKIDKPLPNDANRSSNQDAVKNDKPAETVPEKKVANSAKDFKDSEPAAPANIYDYALQKAKRN